MNAESGSAFAIESAANLELEGVTSRRPADAPVLRLTRSGGAVLRNCRAAAGTRTFLSTGPGELRSVHLEGNILDEARTATEER